MKVEVVVDVGVVFILKLLSEVNELACPTLFFDFCLSNLIFECVVKLHLLCDLVQSGFFIL